MERDPISTAVEAQSGAWIQISVFLLFSRSRCFNPSHGCECVSLDKRASAVCLQTLALRWGGYYSEVAEVGDWHGDRSGGVAMVRSRNQGVRPRQQWGWWKRRTGRAKLLWVLGGLVVFIAIIAAAASAGGKPPSPDTSDATVVASNTTVPSSAVSAPPSLTGSIQVEPAVTSGTSPTVPSASTTTAADVTGELQVHYIDVGQGDSILILAPDGTVMLIDGGESKSGALDYLRTKGITHIDLMVATHPHADHIGGLVDVLNALPVSEVVTNGAPTTTLTYEHFLDGIANAKAVYKEAKRGDTLVLGSLTFDVLSPEGPGGDDLNEGSLVLRLVFGKVAFLFDGDAGQEAEAGMLATGEDVQAQILKVGHHGSNSASSPPFLSAVKPEVAVYCCGVGNSYGHPHEETMTALADVGAKIYGTDVNGTVVVGSDGATYQVDTEKGGARAPPSAPTTDGSTVTSAATSGLLSVEVVSLTSPIGHGSMAKLEAKTAPGAHCTITVYYKSGASEAAGLGSQTASSDGTVTWSWKVGTRTTPGVWSIVVTAEAGGQKESIDIPFEVR